MAVDFYAPEVLEDPYPLYARLRAETPVFFDPEWDLTFFARHRDVVGILKDRRFGRDVRHALGPDEVDQEVYERIYPSRYPTWTHYIRDSFIDLEPPRHTRIRRLVQWAFTRRASESYRPRMETTAERAIRVAVERGHMEAVAEYATPIPLTMIAELLGIPPADQPQLLAWSHAIVRLFDREVTDEEGRAAEQATVEFVEYVRALLAERRRRPGDDLVSAMIAAEHEGDVLSEDELVSTCILTLNAGHEATVHAITNGLLALARHPDAYRWLREDPEGRAASAADELLRFDAPLQMFERWVLEDVDWDGVALRRGTKVGLLFGSANHDETVFDRPEELNLARNPNPYVSFGAGIHYCVGAPLAKVELEVAYRTFARHVTSFHAEPDPADRVKSLVFRGSRRLPLVFD
jgi:cytochrome P450